MSEAELKLVKSQHVFELEVIQKATACVNKILKRF